MWVEEEWNMFQGFDSHDPQPARAIVESHDDPLKLGIGFKSAPRRLSDENIKQLCPTGQSKYMYTNVEHACVCEVLRRFSSFVIFFFIPW